jgi:hypothetical protein
LRSILICRRIGLINWWRREVGTAWVWSLRLVVADIAVRLRRVVAGVLIGCIWLAVFIIMAWRWVSAYASARFRWSILTSFFASTTLAVPVLVIRVASSSDSTSSEAGSC